MFQTEGGIVNALTLDQRTWFAMLLQLDVPSSAQVRTFAWRPRPTNPVASPFPSVFVYAPFNLAPGAFQLFEVRRTSDVHPNAFIRTRLNPSG
jgi:hypothetical protein